MFHSILYIVALILSAQQGFGEPFVNPCPPSRPECILRAAQITYRKLCDGVPQMGISPLDPLYLDHLRILNNDLALSIRDTKVFGLRACAMTNVTYDLEQSIQAMTTKCSIHMSGRYQMLGRILLLPVRGAGEYSIDIRDMVVNAEMQISTGRCEKDGKRYWTIKGWDHSYKTMGGAIFNFKNLFNGNKLLSTPVEKYISSHWQSVMAEVAPPIVKTILGYVLEAVRKLYKHISVDDLIVD